MPERPSRRHHQSVPSIDLSRSSYSFCVVFTISRLIGLKHVDSSPVEILNTQDIKRYFGV